MPDISTVDLLQIIGSNPIPCFQKLHLTDLPTELLDIVFMHTRLSEARLLSSTCRRLSEIGRRYIFGVCNGNSLFNVAANSGNVIILDQNSHFRSPSSFPKGDPR